MIAADQGHRRGSTHKARGMRLTDHRFTVPLSHSEPDGPELEIYAREITASQHSPEDVAHLPWLLYLQGGPGGRGNRPTSLGGWLKEATASFRVLMLDQRGTGLSAPATRQTLPDVGDAAAQAEYLTHFRADSIVADAELIRHQLVGGPWSIYGQSFGGFCALTYLSFAPAGLREVLITGGLAPLTGSADRVYNATYSRVAARNDEYYARYPQDRVMTTRIMRHLETVEEVLPTGERLTPERFQMVGNFLGGNARVEALHYLLEDAFIPTAGGHRLSDLFLAEVAAQVGRATNPLYAVLHESIYAQGHATDWSAWRVLADHPEFQPAAPEPLLTGEMVYPWYFSQDPALVPLAPVAELLAARTQWPALYDAEQLARNTVPVAAAVYSDDIYVDRDLSMETAAAVRGLEVWETSDYHHDGIAEDGEEIFARLLRMCRGQEITVPRESGPLLS
ncbi:alpha/beta fold hydrolase [Paenarthrobacter sp. PH39-S1]|uniref:alpha/beta fold hydrolase n=1 Tax=Paenarthrobacter sp. PH39-S1 TaxID=3046204 RepID=UPI0024B99023|nr:alpha/beta fold hydrolase [Paenarthrobacter sp. PH39-S1]MDJ0355380.1 alpha/beta fold hydrolase [Paenarthrobacter sp. PH39-S1]